MTTHKGGAPRKFDRKLAVRMYFEDKLDSIEIAAKLGVTPSTVTMALRNAGYRLRRKPGANRRLQLDDPQIVAAAELYRSGLSLAQVGHKVGAKPSTLAWWLRQAGVEIRPRSARLEKPV